MEINHEKLRETSTPAIKAMLDYVKDEKGYYHSYYLQRLAEGTSQEALSEVEERIQTMINTLEDELGNRLEEIFIY